MIFCVLFIYAAALSSHVGGNIVQELDDSFIEKSKEGLWLIEFYAPWCGHCKRLEPIFEAVASRLQTSPITVGRIDCTKYTYAASYFSVRGFPTIQFFLSNQSHIHRGDRTEAGIIEFVNRSQGPSVRKLSSVGRYNEAKTERLDNVYFMYIGEDDPNDDLLIKYTELADEFMLQSYFYKGSKRILPPNVAVKTEPTVVVFKDGSVVEYEASDKVVTKDSLHKWVNTERFATFPQAGGGMINEMAHTGLLLVMVVVNEEISEESQRIKQIAEVIATQHRDKYHSKFLFLWIDDASIANNIAMATLDLPGIVVLDPALHYHYVPDSDAMQAMTLQSLMTYLDDIIEGKVKASGGTGFGQRFKRLFYEIYSFFASIWLASRVVFCIIIGVPSFIVGLLIWCLCCMESSDEEMPHDEDDDEVPSLSENGTAATKEITEGGDEDPSDTTEHIKSE